MYLFKATRTRLGCAGSVLQRCLSHFVLPKGCIFPSWVDTDLFADLKTKISPTAEALQRAGLQTEPAPTQHGRRLS